MGLSNVNITRKKSRRTNLIATAETTSGLLFDIGKRGANFWSTIGSNALFTSSAKDAVLAIRSIEDAELNGITAYAGEGDETSIIRGIAHYHISKYFGMGAVGTLFVVFRDCSSDWKEPITIMQNVANGTIFQLGVWTEQSLWSNGTDEYGINLVSQLNTVAEGLLSDSMPLSILLNANTAEIVVSGQENTTKTIDLTKIPSVKKTYDNVSVLIFQEADTSENGVNAMHLALASLDANATSTPVGNVGFALGILGTPTTKVCDSIAAVKLFDLSPNMAGNADIEAGFGNTTIADGKFTSTTPYASLYKSQLDKLDDKGYIMIVSYVSAVGKFFSKDHTCAVGDYKRINRVRTMNKARRNIRIALLPYVNASLLVNQSTGTLTAAQATIISNSMATPLEAMKNAGEISNFKNSVDNTNNLLKDDVVYVEYSITPNGTSEILNGTETINTAED